MSAGTAEPEVKVGLEIHQQLATSTKLFCSCPVTKSEQAPFSFKRRLRPAQSEVGRLDPAAVYEFSKGKSNTYLASPESSCLVEADEEPPHPLSTEAVDITLLIAEMLNSNVVDEIHVMRKIVIDGSNTTGFQRTAVVGLGGYMDAGGEKVGVQSVSVEEDAARILGETDTSRKFALDRLGVPLVEVALDPIRGTPEYVGAVALHLGRALRSTGKVARGLGTIRQDLNVSVSGGRVVEVKGVQKLNLIPKVVAYETARQRGLAEIAERLRKGGVSRVSVGRCDATAVLSETGSQVVQRLLSEGGNATCLVANGFGGVLGWEPYPGVRLGKELAEVARANGLGGIIHSDEFRKQGISDDEEAVLRKHCGAEPGSAIIIVAGPAPKVEQAAGAIVRRLEQAMRGVPAETRAATEDGETRYMRPRPGAQRMYPETDIPLIPVTRARLSAVSRMMPEPWPKAVSRLEESYHLSAEMALRVYDSEAEELFEKLAGRRGIDPSMVASLVVDLPSRLAREEQVPESNVGEDLITRVVDAIAAGRVAKEAAYDVVRLVATGKAKSVEEAIDSMGLSPLGMDELAAIIEEVLATRASLVKEKGEGAFSPLMGELMAKVRGRVDGRLVSDMLRARLKNAVS